MGSVAINNHPPARGTSNSSATSRASDYMGTDFTNARPGGRGRTVATRLEGATVAERCVAGEGRRTGVSYAQPKSFAWRARRKLNFIWDAAGSTAVGRQSCGVKVKGVDAIGRTARTDLNVGRRKDHPHVVAANVFEKKVVNGDGSACRSPDGGFGQVVVAPAIGWLKPTAGAAGTLLDPQGSRRCTQTRTGPLGEHKA